MYLDGTASRIGEDVEGRGRGTIWSTAPGFCLKVMGENTDTSTGKLLHNSWFKIGPAE